MRFIWFLGLLHIAISAHAAPPPDASGQFSDWFRSLTVPGILGAPCCTMANCRMVEARWNDWTRHYEAQVTRERFSTTAWKQILSQGTGEAYQAARNAWMRQWLSRYGANAMHGLKFLKPRSVPFRTRPDTRSFAGQSSTPNPTAYSASSHIRGSDRLPASGERHARSCDGFEPVGVRRRIGRHHQGYRELRLCAAQVFDCCDQH
jgi:hypothetical protein